MNIVLIISSLLVSLTGDPKLAEVIAPKDVASVVKEKQHLDALQKCRFEPSPLIRLECYDSTLNRLRFKTIQIPIEEMGPSWRQAMEQEMTRTDHSTNFIVSQGKNGAAPIILTTPAIGVPPPRPVLMLSCIDSITRLQVALPKEVESGAVMVTTDKTQYRTEWFAREHGYLWESSRGLPGIEEIKRLMNSERMTITGSQGSQITFNISQLEQAAKPLRAACRW
ncbi:type VI secretion system-associated protein VasI [Xenorhabdus szentirmaii]|uniref:Type VI secretion-associated protein, VC_A0118 family n=2 Tax=Xenorhabdus szentirmaii TaxID=290112 RepID=W1J5I4_9GAMM|nr:MULTISPECIES: type VI secretion system-associated protein VasI [Xenorhabdus]MBD2780179.1 type VI secretion system-associated protein TagO [Xenorhabdus sp. 38]MBD2791801.1 type VI secretion system-associated protein TagO [Xenorhabdus sp. CUL]MBD2800027.1 type VI secretion system-associated protein TagO [Xenorhabdus sp. M]MBD2804978.1 type VI secretion system-associated protein TagO [Xenorhabdus sp. ZM]MBD2822355.1 type VI secretion system-associated protein TagO [Xenorhabdus sp. 42]